MSDSSSRTRIDIDYAELHRTGRRVPKDRTIKMETDPKVQAIHIKCDIEDLYESYQIENLTEEFEISNYISKIEDIKRHFRRIHAQLKISEGENFKRNFPNYESELSELNGNFKIANEKLSNLNKYAHNA